MDAGRRRWNKDGQAAYNTAAVNGDIIQSQDVGFIEDLYMNDNKAITFEGGYNCIFSLVSGVTAVNGNVTVNNGAVVIDNFSIEGGSGGGNMSSPSLQDDLFLSLPSIQSYPTSTPEFVE